MTNKQFGKTFLTFESACFYFAESFLTELALLSDTDPLRVTIAESFCMVASGDVVIVSEPRESLLVVEVCAESFFEQLTRNKTPSVKNNFFITIYFFIFCKAMTVDSKAL